MDNNKIELIETAGRISRTADKNDIRVTYTLKTNRKAITSGSFVGVNRVRYVYGKAKLTVTKRAGGVVTLTSPSTIGGMTSGKLTLRYGDVIELDTDTGDGYYGTGIITFQDEEETDNVYMQDTSAIEEAHKAETSQYIVLFELDLKTHGRGIFRFTPNYPSEPGEIIRFGGYDYISLPIEAEGFEWNGQGQQPRPTLKISTLGQGQGNLAIITGSMIAAMRDFVGCPITRIRTFEKFLDKDGEMHPNAMFQKDVFRIDRKTKQSMYGCQFELTSILDQQGQYLPRNMVLKNYCSYVYRYWDGQEFRYDKHYSCPYRGVNCYNNKNEHCDQANDSCSKTISGCLLRFGRDAWLPFQGFPGVLKR